MSKAKLANFRGVAARTSEALALINAPGDYVRVSRGVPRAIVLKCPEGCGENLTINLDPRAGPAWRAFEKTGLLTLYPSVWKDSGCRAHFIVWNNQLLWCDEYTAVSWDDAILLHAVKHNLPSSNTAHRHFEEIAGDLGAIPWEVLWACQALERLGQAEATERGSKFRTAQARFTDILKPI